MREFLPLIIVGAIVGVFSIIFVTAYLLMKRKKEAAGFDRHMKDGEIMARLMVYARPYWKQFAGVLALMLVSIAYDIVSPLLVGPV